MPYTMLLARVQRLAVREFSAAPELTFEEFEQRLGLELFGKDRSAAAVSDTLALQEIWVRDSDWYWPTPLLDPELFRQRAAHMNWSSGKLAEYRQALATIRSIAERHKTSHNPAEQELQRLATEVLQRWKGKDPERSEAQRR